MTFPQVKLMIGFPESEHGLQKICGYHNNSHGKTSHLYAAVSVSPTELLKNSHIAVPKKGL